MFPCPNTWVPIWERLCRTVVLFYPMQIHRKRMSERDRLRASGNTLWHLSAPSYGIINSGHQNWLKYGPCLPSALWRGLLWHSSNLLSAMEERACGVRAHVLLGLLPPFPYLVASVQVFQDAQVPSRTCSDHYAQLST